MKQNNDSTSSTTNGSASKGVMPAIVLLPSVVLVPLTLILSFVLTLSLIIVG